MKTLRIGLSRDFLDGNGQRQFDDAAWRQLLALPGAEVEFLPQPAVSPLTAADVANHDMLLIKRNPLTASTLAEAAASGAVRLQLLVRNGSGFDHIDVPACTAAGVTVCTTPRAVARPVASSALTLMLAFSHRLFERDAMARNGRWPERMNRLGLDLEGRTLGLIGLGNIGMELLRLAQPWRMRYLVHTPRPRPGRGGPFAVEQVDLAALLRQSDFVALCCPLNGGTRNLINARTLALMQPHAYLINTARGELIDEAALFEALRGRRIAGAGLDVFATEPPAADHPFFTLDNVILGAHNLAVSDSLNRDANLESAAAVRRWLDGELPESVLNPESVAAARRKAG